MYDATRTSYRRRFSAHSIKSYSNTNTISSFLPHMSLEYYSLDYNLVATRSSTTLNAMTAAEVIPKKNLSEMIRSLYNSIHKKLKREENRKFREILESIERAQTLAVGNLLKSDIEEIFALRRDKSPKNKFWRFDKTLLEPVPEDVSKYMCIFSSTLLRLFPPPPHFFSFLDAQKV
jgi:hypothetical protein